jgi:hypothetical protein
MLFQLFYLRSLVGVFVQHRQQKALELWADCSYFVEFKLKVLYCMVGIDPQPDFERKLIERHHINCHTQCPDIGCTA